MWYGMMIGVAGLIFRRERTSTPVASSSSISLRSAPGCSTTPLPMRHSASGRRMPDGIRCRTVFLPPMTSVWPALWPPWKRTTAPISSVSRSTILPLPSSPHWAPSTTTDWPMAGSPKQLWLRRKRKKPGRPPAFRNYTPVRGLLLTGTEIAQILGIRIEHHHRVPVGHGGPVGLQAAVEGIELRILAIGDAADLRGPAVAFAAHGLGIALGVGKEHLPLALGLRADALGRLLALGAQLVRHASALGAHAVEHRGQDLAVLRVVDPLDAQVDHLDAER